MSTESTVNSAGYGICIVCEGPFHLINDMCHSCTWKALERVTEERDALKNPGKPDEGETIEDGFGSVWGSHCPDCGKKSMVVVRPGKVQCCSLKCNKPDEGEET